MKFKINGILDFSKAIKGEKEFIIKFTEILKDLNVSFDGSLDLEKDIAADPALEDRGPLN